MFNKSNSLSSTNLPDTFWLTSFGGMGEKPGATTNDCCKTGTFGEGENAVGRSPASAFEGKGATEGASSEKVETKDGTTKFGLHYIWLAALAIRAKTGGKPMPETARAMLGTASWTRMSRERPQPCLNLLQHLTAMTTKARKAGDCTSTCLLA